MCSAELVPRPVINMLRDYCHESKDLEDIVPLMNKQLTDMHNVTLPKRSQIRSLQYLGPLQFLETILTRLQEQKGYFEIDLIEMT